MNATNRIISSKSTLFNMNNVALDTSIENKSLYMGDGTERLRRHKYINHKFFFENVDHTKKNVEEPLSLKFEQDLQVLVNFIQKQN